MYDSEDKEDGLWLGWAWQNADPFLAALGVPLTAKARFKQAVLGFALSAASTPGCIHYSRRPEFYAVRPDRYRPPGWSYDAALDAVDHLVKGGFVTSKIALSGPPFPGQPQSILTATEQLRELYRSFTPPEPQRSHVTPIILRDASKQLKDFKDTARTQRWASQVHDINAARSSVKLGIDNVEDLRRIRSRVHVRRIFNGAFDKGGRLWGSGIYQLRKERRRFITIDGQPTVEHDYKHLHPRLMYAATGQIISGDAYTIDAAPLSNAFISPEALRSAVKIGFQVISNTRSREQALRALVHELMTDRWRPLLNDSEIAPEPITRVAQLIISELVKRHAAIQPLLFRGTAGLRCQFLESELAIAVTLKLMQKGIVSFSVHDSLIVPERYSSECYAEMNAGITKLVAQLCEERRFLGSSTKSFHY